MRVVTILGTRPEIIRLSRIIPKLDDLLGEDHVLVHTGQNYDEELDRVFFEELGLREPDINLRAKGTFGVQMGAIFPSLYGYLMELKPDRFLVLGDTNSSLGAIVAKRLGIPVYHMEAGNRCHDPTSPEEINRKLIDSCADVHLPYTEHARRNLLAEGIPGHRIFVTGNPIAEVLAAHRPSGEEVDHFLTINQLTLKPGFALMTLHRQENVDDPKRLERILRAVESWSVEHELDVVFPMHPRTKNRLEKHRIPLFNLLRIEDPMPFKEFTALARWARLIFTDSGTVQEEACILGTPCVTIRDSTERPETLEVGANIVCGIEPNAIERAAQTALTLRNRAEIPLDYRNTRVSDTVVKLLLGKQPL